MLGGHCSSAPTRVLPEDAAEPPGSACWANWVLANGCNLRMQVFCPGAEYAAWSDPIGVYCFLSMDLCMSDIASGSS
eukprot:4901598-Amphidinium_carterae.2